MNTPRPTPETDYQAELYGSGDAVIADFARKLERERDEAREAIKSSAINTNVRLFDLVRYSRAKLHEDGLISAGEYAWLCGGAEMANSPKGGSPSPRRLEDYDELSEKLEAMRKAIKDAHDALQTAHYQWNHYAKFRDDKDLETANHLEGELYRNGQAAIAKLKTFLL